MNYLTLLEEVRTILARYGLDNFLKNFTDDLINQLMQQHIDKIKLAKDYDTSESLINAAIASQLGASANLADIITDVADHRKLYSLFSQWRGLLLAELGIQN